LKGILFKPWKIKFIAEHPDMELQTRRVIKPQPPDGGEVFSWFAPEITENKAPEGLWLEDEHGLKFLQKPRYQVGEVVYIKEAWNKGYDGNDRVLFRLGLSESNLAELESDDLWDGWHSPMFLKAEDARYFIKILAVRAERLQEITEDDAISEGIDSDFQEYPRLAFLELWNSINKDYQWESNPWLFVYDFKFAQRGYSEI